MTMPIQPGDGTCFRLASGLDLLEDWSRNADDLAKTAVYEILFTIAERSVFTRHLVVDDIARPTEFFVMTRRNLVVKARILSLDAWAISYVGPASDVPGLDPAGPDADSQGTDTPRVPRKRL